MAIRDTLRALIPGRLSSREAPVASAALSAASTTTGQPWDPTRGFAGDPGWIRSIAPVVPRPDNSLPGDRAAGAAGTVIRSGRIRYEEFNPDLENEFGIGDGLGREGVFDKMRRTDPQVKRALLLWKLPILAARWKIEAGDDSDLAKEIAEFVSYNLFEINNWHSILRQSLLMYDFGFSLFEILRGNADVPRSRFPSLPHPYGPGRPGTAQTVPAICWTAIDLRHPRTIYQWAPNPDRPTQLAYVVQRIASSDVEVGNYRGISAGRLLRFTHDQEAGNFAGVAVVRAAVKPWKIKETLEVIDVIRHERQNVGVAKLKCPPEPNPKDLDKLETLLATLGSHERGYITLPNGYEFEFETSGQGEGTKVEDAIARCTREIADNMLAGFMTLGNGDTGSYAMADTQADHYVDAIEVGARHIEATWNNGVDGKSFIRELVDLNYGPQDCYPKLRVTSLKSRDYGAIIAMLPKLMEYGALKSDDALRNFLRDKMDLPPEGKDDLAEEDDPKDVEDELDLDQENPPEENPPGDPNAPPPVQPDTQPGKAPAAPPAKGMP